ncbi:mycothiol synthase [Crossiella equi]|uniref:Mycothiol acetyltransferase n=1 Tax=Crossiella equi TaxID=130796 RepID=A0ABS5AH03_9PSEU|nr:mycothiol synthase [Crossiella equi]MBP2475860.1 mycothiol synthase [Crossiella equi]
MTWAATLSPEEVQAVHELVAAAAEVDGRAPVGEHVLMSLGGEHLLARQDNGQLGGYANLDRDNDGNPVAEFAVHPEHRRKGLGRELAESLVARAGQGLRAWAHGDHPAATRIADHLGFRRARDLWRMRMTFTGDLPDRATPDGVDLRTFRPGQDEEAVVAVNNRAFSWHPEQGGWTTEDVLTREAESWFDANGFFLAERDGQLLGFHWTKVHSARPDTGGEPIGEVYVVGVDPAAQGGGLGQVLTLAGLRHLRELGLPAVMLYVESDNTAAIRVYEKLGFSHWDSDVQYCV